MLRSAGAAVAVAPVELAAARTEGAKDALARYQAEARALGDELTRMRGAVGAFEDAAGVNLLAWSTDPGAVGTTVKAVLASERAEEVARERLSTLRAQLVEAVAAIDRAQPRPRTPQVPGETRRHGERGRRRLGLMTDARREPHDQPRKRWPRSSMGWPTRSSWP